jgi:SAM-dependent methyltransferase
MALSPSFRRFRSLLNSLSVNSLTRSLQYEILNSLGNLGDVLDFGGGSKSHYIKNINCKSYKSINIDQRIEPTWLIKAGDPIPNLKNKFDTVISFNTIEHIYEPSKLIFEFYRILKPGGTVLITTPFLFPIHGHPDDFFRPTPSWYRQTLNYYGFREINIIPLAWGPFSTAASVSGMPGPAKKFRMKINLLIDLLYFYLKCRKLNKLDIKNNYEQFATAFFVRAIK